MVPTVIPPLLREKIVPVLIIGWDPHLCRIPVVQVLSATIVFGRIVIVRIIHVGIIIEPLPIL